MPLKRVIYLENLTWQLKEMRARFPVVGHFDYHSRHTRESGYDG